MNHPNVVHLDEVVDDGKHMVMVMEYLRGGQLLDCLEQLAGEHYSEKTAAEMFQQVGLVCLTPARSAAAAQG